MTQGCRSDRQPNVARSAVLMPSPVQIACPERAPFRTEQQLAGGQAPDRGATPARRGPEFRRGFEAEGKIKGRGTGPRRKACLHVGWRGTRLKDGRAVADAKRAPPLVILRASCAVLCGDTLESAA
jgi:hypothetical protein